MAVKVVLPDGSAYVFNPSFRVEGLEDASRLPATVIDQRPGELVEEDLVQIDPREPRVVGWIYANSRAEAETEVRELARVVSSGVLKLYRDEADTTYLLVRKRALSQTYEEGTAGCVVRCDLRLRASDPWFHAATASQDTQTPAASPHDYQVVSNGTARVPPVITITAGTSDVVDPKLTNLMTGQVLQYVGAVPAGQVLAIDCQRREATLEGAAATGGLLDGFFTDGFDLQPGSNSLRYEGTVGGGMTVRLDWRDRWY